MIAQIVPLRRFPSDHQWFDYAIPDGLELKLGQLVEVPFLRTRVRGIVWGLSPTSQVRRLKPIDRLIRPEVVMSVWQRQVCDAMAQQSCVSLGHVLDSIIPAYPNRPTTEKKIMSTQPASEVNPIRAPTGLTWWYRQRSTAIRWLAGWLQESDSRSRIVLVPTREDGEQLLDALGAEAKTVFVHSLLNKTAYTKIYEAVRLGQLTRIIGTARAVTLPYAQAPQILIDQEEHSAHKQTEQQPRTDIRRVLEEISVDVRITSPAPSVRWWHHHHPLAPPPATGGRRLANLQQVKRAAWLTTEFEAWIDQAIAKHGQLLVIAPQRGYASGVSCRDCFYTVACQSCQQRLRLFRQTSQRVVCQLCGREQSLPATCPRCHGTRWTIHGWGVEHIAEGIRQLWPAVTVTIGQSNPSDHGLHVDTYRGYRLARQFKNLLGLVVVSGDGLLNYPDFSVAERSWQYLARLQAAVATTPLLIQTFSPDIDFWQRWRHGDDQTWYTEELKARQEHHLPPWADQWIARYPGPQAEAEMKKKITTIEELKLAGVTVVALPTPIRPGRASSERLLLSSTGRPLSRSISCAELFPYPWQLDTSVASWLA